MVAPKHIPSFGVLLKTRFCHCSVAREMWGLFSLPLDLSGPLHLPGQWDMAERTVCDFWGRGRSVWDCSLWGKPAAVLVTHCPGNRKRGPCWHQLKGTWADLLGSGSQPWSSLQVMQPRLSQLHPRETPWGRPAQPGCSQIPDPRDTDVVFEVICCSAIGTLRKIDGTVTLKKFFY